MNALLWRIAVVGLIVGVPIARGQESVKDAKLEPPIKLAAPEVPSQKIGEIDLAQHRPESLAALALQTSEQRSYDKAVQLQHWSVVNGGGDGGLYNLACFYSLAANVDAAIYWLQNAAIKEGVDVAWVRRDTDLKNVRSDKRWPRVERFLTKCEEHWETADIFETSLILPDDYDGETPLPMMIGLHGMGSRAKSYVDDDMQEFADDLEMAFLAVSGSQPKGPTSFHWSEKPERDVRQIDRALRAVSTKLKVDPTRVGLFGFSQGGMMAIEIAARYPKRFAGAIALSPGGDRDVNLVGIKASDDHKRQGYVVLYGGKEALGNVLMAQQYVKQTERLGARVIDRPSSDQKTHAYPVDFYAKLPSWIEHIFGG